MPGIISGHAFRHAFVFGDALGNSFGKVFGKAAGAASLVCVLSLTLVTGQAAAGGDKPPSISEWFDADAVQKWQADDGKVQFRLGSQNPNSAPDFEIEKRIEAQAVKEQGLSFWRVAAYRLNYASGGQGWTSRLHIYPHGGRQTADWKNQRGYLSSPDDPKNFEFTVFLRVHELIDASRAQIALKVRGGAHQEKKPDAASCTMMTFSPAAHGSVVRFGKELHHPDYDYVTLTPALPVALEAGRWTGLKLISWLDTQNPRQVHYRLYIDTDPFDLASGKPKNQWRLLAQYTDEEGKDTGHYQTLVNWGGWVDTIRIDGYRQIDFALPSLRGIQPLR